jgi:hypothetical protein
MSTWRRARGSCWFAVLVTIVGACGESTDEVSRSSADAGGDAAIVEGGDADATVDATVDVTSDVTVDAPVVPDLVEMCGAVPKTVAEWEACYLKRECEMRMACDEQPLFTNVAQCVELLDAVEGGEIADRVFERERAVAAGRASLDEQAFTACLVETSATSCSHPSVKPACGVRYAGTIADGQSCYTDVECASPGAECQTAACGDSCCTGVCKPRAKLGEACMDFYACEPGLVCSVNALKCVVGDIGAACADTFECDPGAWCDQGTCQPDLGEGELCKSLLQCASGTVCVGLKIEIEPARCLRASEAGAPCDWFCLGNFHCAVTSAVSFGECLSLPTHGQPCSALLPCIDVNERCGAGQCVERDDIDEPCTDGTCKPGLFCTDQIGAANPVCKARLPDGATGCNRPSQCESYVCSGNSSAPGDCQPRLSTCP